MQINEVADVSKSNDVAVLDTAAVNKRGERHHTMMHTDPMLEAGPTAEQLSVLHGLLKMGACYVDLTIWDLEGHEAKRARHGTWRRPRVARVPGVARLRSLGFVLLGVHHCTDHGGCVHASLADRV